MSDHVPVDWDVFFNDKLFEDRDNFQKQYLWAGSERKFINAAKEAGHKVTRHWVRTWRMKHMGDYHPPEPTEADKLIARRRRLDDLQSAKDHARTEILVDALTEVVTSLPTCPVPVRVLEPSGGRMRPVTQVVHLSDVHFGERVDFFETAGFNEYNAEIASRRLFQLEKIIVKSREVIEHVHEVEELRLLLIGDIAGGDIHPELAETNDLDMFHQWAQGSFVLSQFIRRLAAQYPRVVVVGVPGNHGRLTQQRRYKRRYVNWDFITYQTMSLMLMDQPNVEFDFPMSPFTITKVYDWNFLLYHGDEIKSWMGIPWYGIDRATARLRELFQGRGELFHYVALAHFHNSGELDRALGKVLLNGSLVGGSEYSLGVMFTSSKPTQRVYFVHPEHGKIWEMDNDLSHGDADDHPYVLGVDNNLGRAVRDIKAAAL